MRGAARRAVDVEPVAVGEASLVAVRRTDQEQDGTAFGHRLSVELHVARHVPGDDRPLATRTGGGSSIAPLTRLRSSAQLAPLVGMLSQDLPAQPISRFVVSLLRRRRR